MERFNELRKNWIEELKTLKSLSTQVLYFLLEPDDDNKFFESIDSFKEFMKETQFPDFQMFAIEYLLEYKKQNKPKITTEPYKPNTGTWPFTPLDNEQIQKLTKQNPFPKDPWSPFGPVITYCGAPNYTKDNITSTSIAPIRPDCKCTDCELFDGHDICCHHENFGSITQKSLDNCKNNNLFKEKLI
jgi:hypothetical protein